jgi:hypothetical protein
MTVADRDDLPVVEPTGPPCRHLRHEGMYIYTDGQGSGDVHDEYDSTTYWCLETMKGFGPDDAVVARDACCKTSRTCYEPT